MSGSRNYSGRAGDLHGSSIDYIGPAPELEDAIKRCRIYCQKCRKKCLKLAEHDSKHKCENGHSW